mmetsp:Transcript_34074/g.96582  ORF Transcript_34074/g.96582 Transcript_34074/m.96582 type:complete len:494 (+) Transcript_34074:500-1981(+)
MGKAENCPGLPVAILALCTWASGVAGTASYSSRMETEGLGLRVDDVNRNAAGRAVMQSTLVSQIQHLADLQNGSTVHRWSQEVVDARLNFSMKRFPSLVSTSLVMREEERPTRSQHGSTIAEVAPGVILAAWFGGTYEKMGDVGIWTARYQDGHWGPPSQMAWPERQPLRGGSDILVPCWNPVLLHLPSRKTTFLFYKVGPAVRLWKGYVVRSKDGGLTWGPAQELPTGILGPVKNPPIVLEDGTIISPSSTEDGVWKAHVEISKDGGATWARGEDLSHRKGIIQPAIMRTVDGKLRMVMRSRKENVMVTAESSNDGRTWQRPVATKLRSPNSGLCGVTLADGRVVVVHNRGVGVNRHVLAVSISNDSGAHYSTAVLLEDARQTYERVEECKAKGQRRHWDRPEFSYPTIIQSPTDGLLHITYTFSYFGSGGHCTGRENIKHVVLDPCKLGNPSRAPRPCAPPSRSARLGTDGSGTHRLQTTRGADAHSLSAS